MFSKVSSFSRYFTIPKNIQRYFLSESFVCKNEWNARLSDPVLQKINVEKLYCDIEQSFQQQSKASAIDIDIFVNKVENEMYIDEVADILYKLRQTAETSNTLDSTSHAVIRHYLESGHIENLFSLLDNRLVYGVFLDNYTSCLLLNYFIKAKDYKSAARIAGLLMLQEDFESDLCRALSLYGCYNYLKSSLEPFYEEKVKQEDNEDDKEVKVRVKFLRNEYFDDHFDLRSHKHIVGKTLILLGKEIKGDIGANVQILGNVLYEKYDNALQLLDSDQIYSKNILEQVKQILSNLLEGNNNMLLENLKRSLEKKLLDKNLNEVDFCNLVEDFVKNTLNQHEPVEIEKQKKKYKEWSQIRDKKLKEEHDRLNRVQRIQEVERLTKKMKAEEQKLWFFENEDKIDLQIDSKKVYYPKRWFGKKKKPRATHEEYIPPEVGRKSM